MKKISLCAIAALAISVAGCGGCDKAACGNDGFDKFYTNADADSLVSALGYGMGVEERVQRDQQMYQDDSFSVKDYLKGMQYVMAADTNPSFVQGVMNGARMASQMSAMRQAGINVNPGLFLNEYKRAMLADTLAPDAQQLALVEYQKQFEKYQKLKQSYDSLKIATSEESLANIEKGKEYLTKVSTEDPSVVVDNSGIAYKITEAGEGQVKATDKVNLSMTAKTIEGRQVRAANPANLTNVADLEEGLALGVQKLGKGGKATIYVPGRLAYGIAQRQSNVGPNELIIYEVEVVDVAQE